MYELLDMLEAVPGGMNFAGRQLRARHARRRAVGSVRRATGFKGVFVLRHAHGHLRFSKDIDATRHAPPTHKLEANDVAAAIREASIQNVVQFVPGEPALELLDPSGR